MNWKCSGFAAFLVARNGYDLYDVMLLSASILALDTDFGATHQFSSFGL